MPPAARSSGLASGSTLRGSCTVLLYDSQKGRLRDHNWPLTWVELRGFEPLTPSMRTRSCLSATVGVASGEWCRGRYQAERQPSVVHRTKVSGPLAPFRPESASRHLPLSPVPCAAGTVVPPVSAVIGVAGTVVLATPQCVSGLGFPGVCLLVK